LVIALPALVAVEEPDLLGSISGRRFMNFVDRRQLMHPTASTELRHGKLCRCACLSDDLSRGSNANFGATGLSSPSGMPTIIPHFSMRILASRGLPK